MRIAVCLLIASTALADTPVEQPPPVGASVGVGVGIAIGSLAAGSALLATADKDTGYTQKKAGFHIIADGMFLAPVVSHLIAREWKRAAVFGAVGAALAAVSIGVLEGTDSLLDDGTPGTRIAFGAALAVELLVCGVGLVDSMLAKDRWQQRRRPAPVVIWPTLRTSSQGFSVGVGGLL